MSAVAFTPSDLRKLGSVARLAVESSADRQLAQADLADAFVQCAAYLLEQGEYTHCLQLLRHAGKVCPGYDQLHSHAMGES